MLNVIIEINNEDKAFDVKWILDKEGILEVGKNYCPCCYYRLNSKKNKVIELMNALFKEEAPSVPKSEKVITNMLAEFYSLLQVGSLDFNIVVSKEIIDNRIPLKGIILKEKHVIVEEVSDENLKEKDKEILDGIRKAFSGKAEYQTTDSDEVKDVGMDEFKPDTIKKMFDIMTSNVKLTREDLFKADGSRRPVDEVYEIVQIKKKNGDVKKSLFDSFKELNETSTKEELNIRSNVIDDMLEEVFDILFKKEFSNKNTSSNNKESLKKIFEYGRNNFTGDENIGKPIRDVEDGGCSKLNQVATTLERVRKTATYDMSKNGKPMYSITLNKSIYLFNSIEIYYLGHGGTFKKYYLNLGSNGIPSSNISMQDLVSILLNHKFSNVIDFNQQRYLFDIEVNIPGMYKVIPDIVLLMGDNIPTDFPNSEKLIKDVEVTNFYNLVNPVMFTTFTFKKGMENRTSTLIGAVEVPNVKPFDNMKNNESSFCYVDFVKDTFTFTKNKIEDRDLFALSYANTDINKIIKAESYLCSIGNVECSNFLLTNVAMEALKNRFKSDGDDINFNLYSHGKKDNVDNKILYLRVYQNKLSTTLLPQTNKTLYRISDDNNALSIKKLSTWISAMHQGKDKKYSYKDILITTSALKKLRQEETFGEMNFEEVDK